MNILQVKKYYLLIKDKQQNILFAYSYLGKAFEKQAKATGKHREKQIKVIGNIVQKCL